MSDYYWPASIDEPTYLHMDDIYQIRYTLAEVNNQVSEIFRDNICEPELPKAQHTTYIPRHYHHFVEQFLWKYHLLIALFLGSESRIRGFKTIKPIRTYLMKCIVCLDNVIKSLIRPCQGLTTEEVGAYRSKNFEEYLVTEFLIGRHDVEQVRKFRQRCSINLERIDLNTLDWDKYKERMPPHLLGSQWSYDLATNIATLNNNGGLSRACREFVKISKSVLDSEWISRWVPWRDDAGNLIGPTRVDIHRFVILTPADVAQLKQEEGGEDKQGVMVPLKGAEDVKKEEDEANEASKMAMKRSMTPRGTLPARLKRWRAT